MQIVIVSDTHGSRKNIENVCECNPDADMLIHLGDVEDDEDYIEAILSVQRILWGETMISFQDFRGRKNLNWKDIISLLRMDMHIMSAWEAHLQEEARCRGADM